MELKYRILTLGLVAALAGCGGGAGGDDSEDRGGDDGGPATVERISFSGLVADGYLDGATVCLDINVNKICDDGEPSTTSSTGGVFEITDATQEQRDTYPLLVEVVVGTTIDEDNEGVVLTKPLTLTAPVGYSFVSPLSTMVQNEVEGGATSSAAEQAVQEKLGTTLSLDEDYIAAQESGDYSEAQEAEFERLAQVAQVTARVISDNLATLQEAAASNNVSLDDLISAIVDQVFDALDEIATQVDVIAADENTDFNPDAVAAQVDEELIDLEADTIEEQVQQNQAEEAATVTNLANLVNGDGPYWFWSEIEGDVLSAEYGVFKLNDGTLVDEEFEWTGSGFAPLIAEGDAGYVLDSTNGWTAVANVDELNNVIANEDGSIDLIQADSLITARFSGKETDLEGLNVKVVMSSVDDGDGHWADYLPNDLVFLAGAKGYELIDAGSDELYLFEDWSGCLEENKVGGLCSFTFLQNGSESQYGEAATLAEITSATAYTLTDGGFGDVNAIKAVEVAHGPTNKVWAEIVTGGDVNYYAVNNDHSSITLLGNATWQELTIGVETIYELQPIAILNNYETNLEGNETLVLAVIANYVRNAHHELVSTEPEGVGLLNKLAADTVLDNFSLANYEEPAVPAEVDLSSIWAVYDLAQNSAPQICLDFSVVSGVDVVTLLNTQVQDIDNSEYTLNGSALAITDMTGVSFAFNSDTATFTDSTGGSITISENSSCLTQLVVDDNNSKNLAVCDIADNEWDSINDASGNLLKTRADFDSAVSDCGTAAGTSLAPFQVANLVDTTFTNYGPDNQIAYLYTFSGYDANKGANTGTLQEPDGNLSNFTWEVELDEANDEAATGILVVTYEDGEADELVMLSFNAENSIAIIKGRTFGSYFPVAEKGEIWSGLFFVENTELRSSLSDLVGIYDDGNFQPDGITPDRISYIVIEDFGSGAGELHFYEKTDDGSNCYNRETRSMTQVSIGLFTVGGEPGSIPIYQEGGNWHDDRYTNRATNVIEGDLNLCNL
jgi:hypothetical protein